MQEPDFSTMQTRKTKRISFRTRKENSFRCRSASSVSDYTGVSYGIHLTDADGNVKETILPDKRISITFDTLLDDGRLLYVTAVQTEDGTYDWDRMTVWMYDMETGEDSAIIENFPSSYIAAAGDYIYYSRNEDSRLKYPKPQTLQGSVCGFLFALITSSGKSSEEVRSSAAAQEYGIGAGNVSRTFHLQGVFARFGGNGQGIGSCMEYAGEYGFAAAVEQRDRGASVIGRDCARYGVRGHLFIAVILDGQGRRIAKGNGVRCVQIINGNMGGHTALSAEKIAVCFLSRHSGGFLARYGRIVPGDIHTVPFTVVHLHEIPHVSTGRTVGVGGVA